MLTRRVIFVSAVLVSAIGGIGWHILTRPDAGSRLAIGVLYYTGWNGSMQVRLGITNTGKTTIRYIPFYFDGRATLRMESAGGWTVRGIGARSLPPFAAALLRPGDRTDCYLNLPEGTRQWQVCYKVRTASVRDRVFWRAPARWRGRVWPVCQWLFSDREGPEQEIASGVFVVPLFGLPPEKAPQRFELEALLPGTGEAER